MEGEKGQPDYGGVGGLTPPGQGHGQGNDIALVSRAVRERWPISLERRQKLVTILTQIAEADTFEIEKRETVSVGGNGESAREVKTGSITMPNHRNQIAAARVLAGMVGQNQSDEHVHMKQKVDLSGNQGTVNVVQFVGDCWSMV